MGLKTPLQLEWMRTMSKYSEGLRRIVPKSLRRRAIRYTRYPPVGHVDLGDLRRVQPISRAWGGDRGLPIDRHYIESFLSARAGDIQGRVLEVGDNAYTVQFGGDRVDQSDVVHAEPGNPLATFVADFADAPQLPSDAFDCIICTQTLHLVADLRAAAGTLRRILRPEGVLLATVPGISKLYQVEGDRWRDYWRFTPWSARWLFEEAFAPGQVEVTGYGNVLAAVAFLHGLAAEELQPEELDPVDPQYAMLIGVRAARA